MTKIRRVEKITPITNNMQKRPKTQQERYEEIKDNLKMLKILQEEVAKQEKKGTRFDKRI